MSSFPQIDPAGSEPGPSTTSLWKDEVAERLAAHRSRGGRRAPISDLQGPLFAPAPQDANRATRIAAAIAARYALQPSYRDLLAQQEAAQQRLAEEQAQAERDAITAIDAERASIASQLPLPEPPAAESSTEVDPRRRYIETSHRVVLHAPMPSPLPQQQRSRAAIDENDARRPAAQPSIEELLNSVLVEPTVPLPAKLIEFPRELIAARKARPRIAEGPLLEDSISIAGGDPAAQLRIFEVENASISHQPAAANSPADAPVWSNIRLDDTRAPRWESETPSASHFVLPLQPAPLSRRALAAAIDLACVAAALVGFEAVFFFATTHPPQAKLFATFSAGVFVLLLALYQLMFFTFSESTPGMRAARIAMCTFDDTNPTRRAMRMRLGAVLLAACPLGLGLLWAIIDEDSLGWHDRIARIYQRSY